MRCLLELRADELEKTRNVGGEHGTTLLAVRLAADASEYYLPISLLVRSLSKTAHITDYSDRRGHRLCGSLACLICAVDTVDKRGQQVDDLSDCVFIWCECANHSEQGF